MSKRDARQPTTTRLAGGVMVVVLAVGLAAAGLVAPAAAQEKKPNILVIMGDDVGWFNIGAYHQGIMSGKTPNLDKLAVPTSSPAKFRCERA